MNKVWETLFSYALKQLDGTQIAKTDWSFGGGTVLSYRFDHRESKDIDIFFRTPQLLNFISPRINDGVEDKLKFYTESSHHVRLQFDEGEVDFITAPQISQAKPSFRQVLGTYVYVDEPVEIVAKKIQFRAEEFKPRDVFDLAVVFDAQKDTVLNNSPAFAEKLDSLEKRIIALNESGILESGLQSLAISPGGQDIRGKEYEICRDFIQSVQKQLAMDKKHG